MKNMIIKTLGLLTVTAFFTACNEDTADEMMPQQARVMVVHASPNAPAVDVRVNNTVALSNVPYPNNSAYLPVNAGSTNIKVSPTGTTTYVIDATVNLAAGMNYSVFAVDSVNKIKAAVVTDNLSAPASGKAHVRFLHFSPNAPAVDIAVANGGPVLFSNRTFNDQGTNTAAANFTPVDAGTYNLEVRLAGTNTVVLPLNGIALENGKIYTAYARGFVGGTGTQALGAGIIVNN